MRQLLWSGLLLLLPWPCQAGMITLGWDYPVTSQPNTTYTLHIVTLRAGQPVAEDRPLPLLPLAACGDTPDPAFPLDRLCGRTCLEPGDYTLSLFAIQGGQRSRPSNVLDLDLTSATPCPKPLPPPFPLTPPGAAPVVPKPGSPSKGGGTAPGAGGLAVTGAVAALLAAQSVPPPLPALVNRGCVSWKVLGPCFCTPFTPCLTVEYYEPAYLIETTKLPGDTLVPGLGEMLSGALAAAGGAVLGAGGAGNATGSGHTNLQYGEAHVWSFPQLLGGPCTACAPGPPPVLHYASELDPTWRTAVAVPSPLDLVTQLGTWARLYPRGGHVIHSSEPVASGVQAARALDILRQPVGTPPNPDLHVILAPGSSGTPACLQMAWPKQTPCFQTGMPPALWETGALSLRGKYLWIAWKRKTCCVDPSRTTCGITLPGIGGHGANICPLPQLP